MAQVAVVAQRARSGPSRACRPRARRRSPRWSGQGGRRQSGVDRHRSAFLRCGWSRALFARPLAVHRGRGCRPARCRTAPPGVAAGCRGPGGRWGCGYAARSLPGPARPSRNVSVRRGSGRAAATAGGGRRRPTCAGPRWRESVEPNGLSPGTHQPSPSARTARFTDSCPGRAAQPRQHDVARPRPARRTGRARRRRRAASGDIDGPRTATRRHRTCDLPGVFGLRAVGYVKSRQTPERSSTEGAPMRLLSHILRPRLEATAHCDLPCGVYDPAQARIEAESVKAIQEKYQGNEDPVFRARAIADQGAARRPRQAPPVGAVDRLLQAPALREVPGAARAVQQGHQGAGGGPGGTGRRTDPATGQELLD